MERLTYYLMWAGAVALVALFVYFGLSGFSSGKRSPELEAQVAIDDPASRLH